MARGSDPLQRESNDADDVDLYDVATWEPRSVLDRISVTLYRIGLISARVLVIVLALIFLVLQLVLGGLGAIVDPVVGFLVLLSIVPALGLAAYVWYLDITTREPLSTLLTTIALAILFAMFAAVINTLAAPAFVGIPLIGLPLFFLIVVGPVEEAVKLLAVRLHAYRHENFNAVVDGAVYGAAAGLGFATIENALYITATLEMGIGGADAIAAAGGTVAARTLAGPGHVLYSAIAGYYLGLARFNPENAGPIVVKGLLLAVLFHATYNTVAVGIFTIPIGTAVSPSLLFLGFIVVYFGGMGYFLFRRIANYRHAFERLVTDESDPGRAAGEPAPNEDEP